MNWNFILLAISLLNDSANSAQFESVDSVGETHPPSLETTKCDTVNLAAKEDSVDAETLKTRDEGLEDINILFRKHFPKFHKSNQALIKRKRLAAARKLSSKSMLPSNPLKAGMPKVSTAVEKTKSCLKEAIKPKKLSLKSMLPSNPLKTVVPKVSTAVEKTKSCLKEAIKPKNAIKILAVSGAATACYCIAYPDSEIANAAHICGEKVIGLFGTMQECLKSGWDAVTGGLPNIPDIGNQPVITETGVPPNVTETGTSAIDNDLPLIRESNVFTGLGTNSIGGGRASSATSPTANLSSSEIISMIKKGTTTSPPATSPTRPQIGTTSTYSTSPKNELLESLMSGKSKSEMTVSKPPDDFGMLGLTEIIKTAHSDRASLALGADSEAIINALNAQQASILGQDEKTENGQLLCNSLASPWMDIGAPFNKRPIGASSLESILPSCYNVQAPPHAATRITSFAEETLFYMFYGMPRDRMQEMAARELTVNRGWKYHKELRIWVLPSSATPTASSATAGISNLRISPSPISIPPSQPLTGETASYIVFDASTWSKLRRELPILKKEVLEDRFDGIPSSGSSLLNRSVGVH